jgi:hypothetical protein
MEVFSECWYCFSVLARAAIDGKSRQQQQFEDLYSDDDDEDLQPLQSDDV